MAKKSSIEIHEHVEELFRAVQSFIEGSMRSGGFDLKIQVEQDFRGKPALTLRVREQGVDTEIMKPLRYPEA